jgi:hypothetical protein
MLRFITALGCIVLTFGMAGCTRAEPAAAKTPFAPTTSGVEGVCWPWHTGGRRDAPKPGVESPREPSFEELIKVGVAGVNIKLNSLETGEVYEGASDVDGKFRIGAKPGKYKVEANHFENGRPARADVVLPNNTEVWHNEVEVFPDRFKYVTIRMNYIVDQ